MMVYIFGIGTVLQRTITINYIVSVIIIGFDRLRLIKQGGPYNLVLPMLTPR